MKTQHEYFGTKRGLSVEKVKHPQGCVKVKANVDGRVSKWVVCSTGAKGSLPAAASAVGSPRCPTP